MAGPKYLITADKDGASDSAGGVTSRNPSHCVAFVRFSTPSAILSGHEDAETEKSLLVVENDCVSVSTDAPKNGFAKTATLTMKIGEIFYQNAVSPGDYVFVWMANYQDHIEGILNTLLKGKGSKGFSAADQTKLNGWMSGLKFFGRVMSVSHSDSISSSGVRSLNQTISCQSFLELASSVYYTFVAQNLITLDGKLRDDAAGTNFYQKELERLPGAKKVNKNSTSATQKPTSNGMESALTNFSKAFENFYRRVDGKDDITGDTSPEAIIGLMFILTMGIESKGSFANNLSKTIPSAKGQFSDAIIIPASASWILGKPKAKKLWQIYNLYLGLQEYTSKVDPKQPYVAFSPKFTDEKDPNSVLYRTPTKCKGYIPFMIPPIWDNNTFWGIYNQFLNPVVNEMYTALRINRFGSILPTLIVREKPFSTDLYDVLLKKAPILAPIKHKDKKESEQVKAVKKNLSENQSLKLQSYTDVLKVSGELAKRTYYNNLPRWVIDESVILSINASPSESNRINFVQVWGRSRQAELLGLNINQEVLKVAQFEIPNYVEDQRDIARHGLRADITETNYDVLSNDLGSISHILCRMRADWLFNGQLKPFGTITLQGVQEPICEGDNIEVRGVLFHIDAVRHESSIDPSGRKTFKTVLSISNGIIAKSLDDNKINIPQYPTGNFNYQKTETLDSIYNHPGMTDVQVTGSRKDRDESGERK